MKVLNGRTKREQERERERYLYFRSNRDFVKLKIPTYSSIEILCLCTGKCLKTNIYLSVFLPFRKHLHVFFSRNTIIKGLKKDPSLKFLMFPRFTCELHIHMHMRKRDCTDKNPES